MHRLSKIAFVGMLALAIAGCDLGSEETVAPTPSTSQVTAPKSFEKPSLVVQDRAVTVSAADGLIQPTNVNQRARQVQKGREDPFAVLFVPVFQKVPQKIVPQRPNRLIPPKVVARDSGSNPNRGNAGSQLPRVLPPTLPVLPPPPPPQPDLARAVTVTGVVQVGSEPQAIVKVPNEATSRYVRVGQRLSNGQVLVKRIEVNEGSDPVVILEQNGTEVRRSVGEEPVNPTQAATPAAAIPAPPPPINNAFRPINR